MGQKWGLRGVTQSSSVDRMARKDKRASPDEEIDVRLARSLLRDSGLSLAEAARLALAGQGPQTESVTVGDGVERYLRARLKALRPATWTFYRKYLDNFAATQGGRLVSQIDAAVVAQWVGVFPEASQPHARRTISAWLHYAAEQQPPWIAAVPKMPKTAMRERGKEIGFLTVAEAEAILRGVPDAFRAAVAIALFAGLRPEEIHGQDKPALQWQAVQVADRMIRVSSALAKTREPRLLEGLPDCLWSWLEPGTGDVCAYKSEQITRQAQLAAGFVSYVGSRVKRIKPWPSDALRHTFATYHVAAFGDAAKTALLLGHRDQVMLYRHYRGLATRADGQAFFRLNP